jgi:hypothetical protein
MDLVTIVNAEMSPFFSRSIVFSMLDKIVGHLPPYHKIALKHKRSTMPEWGSPEKIEVEVVEKFDKDGAFEVSWFQKARDINPRFIPKHYVLPIAALQGNIWARHHQRKDWDRQYGKDINQPIYIERAEMITIWEDFQKRLPADPSQLRKWIHVPLVIWWTMTKHDYAWSQSDYIRFMSSVHAKTLLNSMELKLASPEVEAAYIAKNCVDMLRFKVQPLDRRFVCARNRS